MKAFIACFFSLLGASLTFSQSDEFDELPLNGIATYEQLRQQYYIGALYLSKLTQDADAILDSSDIKRMDLRIMIDKWTPRRFSQQWKQAILINNDQASLERFSAQILLFLNMPKEHLISGDRITIDSSPDLGVSVYLNKQKVFTENNHAFFTVLLNAWIGQRPPSSEFKNNILSLSANNNANDMLVAYERLIPTDNRAALIKKWIGQPLQKTTMVTAPPPIDAPPGAYTAVTAKRITDTALDNTPPDTKQTTLVKTTTTTAVATITATNKSVDNTEPLLSGMTADASASTETTALANPSIPDVKKEATASQTLSTPAGQQLQPTIDRSLKTPELTPVKTAVTESIAIQIPADNTPESSSPRKPEQASPLAQYRSEILNLTYKNAQYPKRAMSFKQEGIVIVRVRLDRTGDVLDMLETTSSDYKLLNNAALKAVRKTAPFPAVPDDVLGDIVEISLPFSFKL